MSNGKELIVDITSNGLGEYQNPINLVQINSLLNTDKAVKYFETLTENFLYFLKENNILSETNSFQVSIAPRYFFDSSVISESTYRIDLFKTEKILKL